MLKKKKSEMMGDGQVHVLMYTTAMFSFYTMYGLL